MDSLCLGCGFEVTCLKWYHLRHIGSLGRGEGSVWKVFRAIPRLLAVQLRRLLFVPAISEGIPSGFWQGCASDCCCRGFSLWALSIVAGQVFERQRLCELFDYFPGKQNLEFQCMSDLFLFFSSWLTSVAVWAQAFWAQPASRILVRSPACSRAGLESPFPAIRPAAGLPAGAVLGGDGSQQLPSCHG